MMASAKPRVLLVDDDVDTCDLYMAALRPSGFQVAAASDGALALERLLAERFDVTVVDIGLGSFGGLDLVRRVKAQLSDRVPYFIAVSGYASARDRGAGIEAGFREYHAKPFSPVELVAAVHRGVAATRAL